MNYSYIIIDDDQESVLKTKAMADSFSELDFVASANNYEEGLNLILEHTPQIVFLEIDPVDPASNLSLALINELHRYLKVIPKIIITTARKDLAFDAIKYEIFDYLIKPLTRIDVVKSVLKLNKSIVSKEVFLEQSLVVDKEPTVFSRQETPNQDQSLILCIKSYGDYRYIAAKDICYFQADNNSTDIYLNNGEMITAFKTLKHFEGVLSFPFIRIHNSYIVNRNYISRIHSGNSVCYIKNSAVKLPFSKSYRVNIDLIISDFSNGNYLEI
ncbi:LytR/AlgR family response regulator transcription factor [Flavobacterium sp. LB3P21]|uniref:LytR/AlgR family response regulator transcription factor n=1 Tax=unclassified Flavobacterium TaxID=196869 RepID=UPI003AAB9157